MRLGDLDALKDKAWDADTRYGYVQVVDVGDIDDTPTIDAVPVVRCKDCKHYWKNKNTPGYLDKCVTVNDDDYCSDGEQKGGEG